MHQSKEIFDTSLERSKRLRNREYNSDSDEEEVEDDLDVKDEEDEGDFDPAEVTSTITFITKGSVSTLSNGKKQKQTKKESSSSRGLRSGKTFKPAFKALHDDFMLGAKLKDWDHSDNDEGEME